MEQLIDVLSISLNVGLFNLCGLGGVVGKMFLQCGIEVFQLGVTHATWVCEKNVCGRDGRHGDVGIDIIFDLKSVKVLVGRRCQCSDEQKGQNFEEHNSINLIVRPCLCQQIITKSEHRLRSQLRQR